MKFILFALILAGCATSLKTVAPLAVNNCLSPSGTTLPVAGTICDGTNSWALVAGIVYENGVKAGFTQNVTLLLFYNSNIYQQNASALWWVWQGGTWVGTKDPRVIPPPPPVLGQFSIKNGQFIDPKGLVFVPRGVDIDPSDMSSAQSILTLFKGINYIRLASGNLADPASFKTFIDTMTAKGVAVEIEHHPWPLVNALTGSALATESNWYASLASLYKANPYVWFGSMNEPQGGDLSAQHLATYNAIRNTGSKAIVLFDSVGGGNPGFVGCQMTTASYKAMTNVGWDLHFYGWVSGMSTDQNVVNNAFQGSRAACSGVIATQNIPSGDGQMPVVIGEFGDSTNGQDRDVNWQQVISAVVNSGYGYAAWHFGILAGADRLIDTNGALTDYGRLVAAGIVRFASPLPKKALKKKLKH